MTIPLGNEYTQDQAVAQALYAIAASLDRVAEAVTANTAALQAARTSPGAAVSSAPPGGQPPVPRGAPGPKGEKTIQQKRGGLIWGICKDHDTTVAETGAHVLGRPMGADARTWADADQQAVLDAMKKWAWIEDNR